MKNAALNTSSKTVVLILAALFALFGLGLTFRTMNSAYFVMLLVALFALHNYSPAPTLKSTYQSAPLLHWAFGSMTLALVITQLAHWHFDPSPYNPIVRLATFLIVFWLFKNISYEKLMLARWFWIIGTIVCAIQIYYFVPRVNNRPYIENWYIAMTSLLGVFSMLSLFWDERPGVLKILAHTIGGICSMYVVFVSQTRGVWLSIPIFILLTVIASGNKAVSVKKIVLFLVFCCVSGAIFYNTDLAKARVHAAESDIQTYMYDANADTSVGARFQLWRAACLMIEEHPIFGVGAGDSYKAALEDMVERKVLPTYYNGAHSHNEVLFSTATMGVFGLIAILMTYFVPAYYFGRHLFDSDRRLRTSAALGLSVCLGFFIYGLVDVLFKYKETEVIYCVSCALFYACVTGRKLQLGRAA